jgi:hypothetical protein
VWKRWTRRSFLAKSTVVATALAVNPIKYLLRPGTAYASMCGPDADCASGWTVFCCSVNNGRNECPPGSIPAGWWKSDNSSFCGGGPRYILDCNATCGSCGCGSSGICAPGCYNCGCRCGTGSCDERRHCCNQFRYGQCHQELACVGPVVCRVATCAPPWLVDATCTTASATANETALHTAPCLDGEEEEAPDMYVVSAPSRGIAIWNGTELIYLSNDEEVDVTVNVMRVPLRQVSTRAFDVLWTISQARSGGTTIWDRSVTNQVDHVANTAGALLGWAHLEAYGAHHKP